MTSKKGQGRDGRRAQATLLLAALLIVGAAAFVLMQAPSQSDSSAASPTGAAVIPAASTTRAPAGALRTADANTPGISFVSPTPEDGASTTSRSVVFNVSVVNAAILGQFIWQWDGTNYSMYDSSLKGMWNFDDDGIDDNFTGTSLNTRRWTAGTWEGGSATQNGAVFLTSSYSTPGVYSGAGVWSKDVVSGDFDFQVDFADLAFTNSPNNGGMFLYFYIDGSNNVWVGKLVNGQYGRAETIGGVGGSYFGVTDAATSGTLRIRRVGSSIYRYFKNSTGWYQLGDPLTGFPTGPGSIRPQINIEKDSGTGSGSIYVDNVTVINGETAHDASMSPNNGTIYGANGTAGRYGQGLYFDGASAFINMTGLTQPGSGNFSFAFWAQPQQLGVKQAFLATDVQKWGVELGADNVLGFYIGDGANNYNGVGSAAAITSGQWYHVAGVMNSTHIVLYMNGAYSNRAAKTITLNSASTSYVMGRNGRWAGSGDYFKGVIDEVRVWNRSLSADEIRQQYQANFNKYDADKWSFYANQSNLSYGAYSYQSFASGASGSTNTTGLRTVIIGNPPILQFVSPTPDNGNVTGASSVTIAVNVSNASGLQDFSFNWNGSSFTSYNQSLIGMWSFEDLPMDDSFDGPDGSLPDSNRYSTISMLNGSSIRGNRLMCNATSTQPNWFYMCQFSSNRRPFQGDFDISIFMDESNFTGSSGYYMIMEIFNATTPASLWSVGAMANSDYVFTYPDWFTYSGYGVSSYVRMRRIGTTLYAYARTYTGNWNLLATKTNIAGPVYPVFRAYTSDQSHTGGRGYFDDLRVYEGQLVNDSSQLGMTPMTIYNASWATGKYGQGASLSGVSGNSVRVNDTGAYGGMPALSVEAWVNFNGLGPLYYMGIVSKWDNSIGASNSFFLGTNDTAAKNIGFLVQTTGGEPNSYSSLALARGNWTHLLGTYNGSKAILYVNGDKIYEYAVTGTVRQSADFLCFGCHDSLSNNQNNFNGSIDEVRIWNRSFNEVEARELYNSNLRPNGTGAWQFSTTRTSLTAGGNYSYSASATTEDGTGTTGTRTILLTQGQTAPVVTSINLTSTDLDLNDTSQNLTLQLAVSDANGDPVANITNWYRSGASIALLNMPFEINLNDYSGFGNTGSANGTSISGGAAVFTTTSQIQVPDSVSLRATTAWSVEARVNSGLPAVATLSYKPSERNPTWSYYSGYGDINTLNDGNTATGIMPYTSPADVLLTFTRPVVITSVTVNCGQFNGDYNLPASMTLYEGNQVSTSLAALNVGYSDTVTAISGAKGSRQYVIRINKGGSDTGSTQEITVRGYSAGAVLEKENAYSVIYGQNLVAYTNGNPVGAPSAALSAGPHHVAATYGGGTMKLYVDGSLISSAALSAPSVTSTPLHIGQGFNGSVSHVRMYNRTLSAAQVALLARNVTDTIASGELAGMEVWRACVTPNDGTQDGSQACSNNVTVSSGEPVINSINLTSTNPATNDTNQNLTLQLAVVSPIGRNITNITTWYRNGASLMLLNMPLDDSAIDYGGFGNMGTATGTSIVSNADRDGSNVYYFNGNAYVQVPDANSLDLGSSWTMEAAANVTYDNTVAHVSYTVTPRNPPFTYYDVYNDLSTLGDLNNNTGPMITSLPAYLTFTFNQPVVITRVVVNAGQFNGNYNIPSSMTLYEGNQTSSSLSSLSISYDDVTTLVTAAKGSSQYVVRVADGGSLQEINFYGYVQRSVVSKEKAYGLSITGDRLWLNTPAGVRTASIAQGWRHIVAAGSAGAVSLYVDGALANGTAGLTSSATDTPLYIGRGFVGGISNVRMWNRSLSAEQVAMLYQNRTDVIVSQETDGDTWRACVTPYDGFQDGAQACSNNVTVPLAAFAISGVVSGNVTNDSAAVAWETDFSANTTVQYGTTTALGSHAGADNSVTQHSVSLSGLQNGTTYYYNVSSCTAGVCENEGPYSFTTFTSLYPNCPNTTGIWTLASSTSRSGNVTCNSVTVPLGITLTASGALRIDADSVTVAGAIAGTGTGCPESQSPNIVTNVCYDGGGGAGYGEGADGGWNEGGGGGYGGNGGTGTIAGGMRYGDPLNPRLLGSGGGHGYGGSGGAGGGALRIVANSVSVTGTISMNGANGGYDAGGGSGGSVWIETSTISGSGSISARGGNAGSGSGGNQAIAGAGAGGRVAIYTNSNGYSGSILVTPGTTYTAGQVGTAILVDLDDNAAWITSGFEFNKSVYYAPGSFKPTAVSDYNFNSLSFLPGSLRVGVSANVSADTLNMSGASITCYAALSPLLLSINSTAFPAHSARLVTNHYIGSTLTFSGCGPLTIDDPADQMGGTTTTSNNDILVTTQGNMTSIITTASTAIINASTLTIGGTISARTAIIDVDNLTLTGTINGKGNGCPATQSPNLATGVCYDRGTSANLGEGSDANFGAGGGGAYGGAAGYGTNGGGSPYGNPLQPIYPGSGGGNGYNYAGGAGGGAVRIISTLLNVSGSITVDGNNAAGDNGGGGSGGSVWIEADSIMGSGSITARGGAVTGTMGGQNTPPGSGSGGRIAIYVNSSTHTGRINVSGGATYAVGEAGTAIFVILPQNAARISDGFDFNKTVYYAPGSFKPTAESGYSFTSLQTTSSRILLGLHSNVSADTFNISGTTLTCRNGVGTLLLAVNSTSLPEHAVRVATNHYYGSSLSTTSCGKLVIDDLTDQLNTTSINSDNDITLLTQGSIGAITSAASTIIVNASSLTANGNIVGRTSIIDADTFVLNGNINSQGTGCPASQSPNLDTGACYNRGSGAGIGEGSDGGFNEGGGGAYGGTGGYGTNGGGTPYGNPLQPLYPGSGGGNGYGGAGGAGGGALRITSSTLTLNGNVVMNGNNGGSDAGGGSGGGVFIETNSLAGAGSISSRGGNAGGGTGGNPSTAGSGSGGRIAIYYNTSMYTGSINTTGGMTYATGERGTAIAVDVNDNTAVVYDGFEFNGTVTYPGASFKRSSDDGYNFNRLDAPGALLRYVGTTYLNATLLNLVNADSKIQVGTRTMLKHASQSSNLGKTYARLFNAAGSFYLSVDNAPYGRVDWLGSITNLSNFNNALRLTDNNVFVNATQDRGLNTSANISIVTPMTSYGIIFDQFDAGAGTLCTFCTNYGAANGQGRFGTTHFSSYWLSAPHAFVAPVNVTVNDTFVFNGTTNSSLSNGTLYDIDQVIQVVERSTGRPKLELTGAFSTYPVNLSSLIVVVAPTKTVVVANGLTGVSATHTMFVPITTGQGVYVCPNATTIETIAPGCEGYTHWTYAQAVAGTSKQLDNLGYNATVTIVGNDYRIAGLRGTGSGEGGVTSLRIWDETELDGSPYAGFVRRQGEQIVFFANFTNASGLPANTSNGGCVVDFADMSYNGYEAMRYNPSTLLYEFNRSFALGADRDWKVNCSGVSAGVRDNVEANDTVDVQGEPQAVPEFGTWALLAALGLVAGGIVSMRGKGSARRTK